MKVLHLEEQIIQGNGRFKGSRYKFRAQIPSVNDFGPKDFPPRDTTFFPFTDHIQVESVP